MYYGISGHKVMGKVFVIQCYPLFAGHISQTLQQLLPLRQGVFLQLVCDKVNRQDLIVESPSFLFINKPYVHRHMCFSFAVSYLH